MRSSALLTGAIAAGALAAPTARDDKTCVPDGLIQELLALLPVKADICINMDMTLGEMHMSADAAVQLNSACSCLSHFATGVPTASASATAAVTTSVRKCKPPKPSLTAIGASSVPSVAVPTGSIGWSSVSMPSVGMPSISMPTASVGWPSVSAPSVGVPTGTAGWPAVSVPSGGLPTGTAGWPSVSAPSIGMPTGTAGWPSVSAPSIGVPTGTAGWPSASVPTGSVAWPSVSVPTGSVAWPSVSVPTGAASWPSVSAPTGWPTVGWPSGALPTGTGSWPVPTITVPTGSGSWPSVPTTGSWSAAAPSLTGSACPAPTIPGGGFEISGSMSANAGWWLDSLTGSCGAKVFPGGMSAGASGAASFGSSSLSLGSVAGITIRDEDSTDNVLDMPFELLDNTVLGDVTAGISKRDEDSTDNVLNFPFELLDGTVLGDATAGISKRSLLGDLNLSGDLANLVGAGTNFLQVTGSALLNTQSVCQKVTLCKGQSYTISVQAAADAGPDVLLQFAIGAGSAITSPSHSITGGHSMSASGDISFTFTWDAPLLEVPICILTTIAHDLQSVALASVHLAAAVV